MSIPDSKSESGEPIYRHQAQTGEQGSAQTDVQAAQALEWHIDQYIGSVTTVFHELISEYVHVDVYIVSPSTEHNFYTLITMGMSDLPMTVPSGAEHLRYAELMLCLPENWKMSRQDWQDDDTNYWPVRWLKTLVRLPHQYNTWLASGHSVPNDDPPQHFATNTEFCGSILATPVLFQTDFARVSVRPDKVIRLYSVIPLYKEEMDFKLKQGAGALFNRLDEGNVSELLDIRRKNTCYA